MNCSNCEYLRTSVNLVRGDCETKCNFLRRRIDINNPPKDCPKEFKNGKE